MSLHSPAALLASYPAGHPPIVLASVAFAVEGKPGVPTGAEGRQGIASLHVRPAGPRLPGHSVLGPPDGAYLGPTGGR